VDWLGCSAKAHSAGNSFRRAARWSTPATEWGHRIAQYRLRETEPRAPEYRAESGGVNELGEGARIDADSATGRVQQLITIGTDRRGYLRFGPGKNTSHGQGSQPHQGAQETK
jgi:hypothetical protein